MRFGAHHTSALPPVRNSNLWCVRKVVTCSFSPFTHPNNVESRDMMPWLHEVTVQKKDGRTFFVANAIVKETNIILESQAVSVEPGDIVTHQLPCAVDHYLVLKLDQSPIDGGISYLEVSRRS